MMFSGVVGRPYRRRNNNKLKVGWESRTLRTNESPMQYWEPPRRDVSNRCFLAETIAAVASLFKYQLKHPFDCQIWVPQSLFPTFWSHTTPAKELHFSTFWHFLSLKFRTQGLNFMLEYIQTPASPSIFVVFFCWPDLALQECIQPFGVALGSNDSSKHHCRQCGRVICDACSKEQNPWVTWVLRNETHRWSRWFFFQGANQLNFEAYSGHLRSGQTTTLHAVGFWIEQLSAGPEMDV